VCVCAWLFFSHMFRPLTRFAISLFKINLFSTRRRNSKSRSSPTKRRKPSLLLTRALG
jgi:hypothetical protein